MIKQWNYLSDFVKPICLPLEDRINENYTLNQEGDPLNLWVAGWGSTDPKSKYSIWIKTGLIVGGKNLKEREFQLNQLHDYSRNRDGW